MQCLLHRRTPSQNSAFLICNHLIYIQFTAYELNVRERAITYYNRNTLSLSYHAVRRIQVSGWQWCFKEKRLFFIYSSTSNSVYKHMHDFESYSLDFTLSTT